MFLNIHGMYRRKIRDSRRLIPALLGPLDDENRLQVSRSTREPFKRKSLKERPGKGPNVIRYIPKQYSIRSCGYMSHLGARLGTHNSSKMHPPFTRPTYFIDLFCTDTCFRALYVVKLSLLLSTMSNSYAFLLFFKVCTPLYCRT
jgi:hypothetical protein